MEENKIVQQLYRDRLYAQMDAEIAYDYHMQKVQAIDEKIEALAHHKQTLT